MDKILHTGDQEALLKEAGRIVTVIEDGAHVKQAASSAVSREMLEANRPDKDHFLIHLIAMGDGERWGFNKNGDHWPQAGLEHDHGGYGHHTFVKFGHYFEEHNNRDPKKARGIIKASCYNTPMRRVELVAWGHKKKAAEDFEMAKQGKELSFSMSAKVPYDRCNICEKKAKSSRDYCDHAKYHMTQWMPEHRKFAFVINDEPCFFDISKVRNPADRIAHHLEYLFSPDELAKAASEHRFIFSDQQAERAGILLPELRTGCVDPRRQFQLTKLAAHESYLEKVRRGDGGLAQDGLYWFAKSASTLVADDSAVAEHQLEALRQLEPDCLFRHLAKESTVLPFQVFYAYATNQSLKQAAADPICIHGRAMLPTLFRSMLESPVQPEVESMFDAGSHFKSAYYGLSPETASALSELANSCSLDRRLVDRALTKAASVSLSHETQRVAAALPNISAEEESKAKRFATAYGFYKIAFVEATATLHGNIDDPILLLVTSQH